MKEIDDTIPPTTESEGHLRAAITIMQDTIEDMSDEIDTLRMEMEQRLANLEARKPPQDTNPDPEWYS